MKICENVEFTYGRKVTCDQIIFSFVSCMKVSTCEIYLIRFSSFQLKKQSWHIKSHESRFFTCEFVIFIHSDVWRVRGTVWYSELTSAAVETERAQLIGSGGGDQVVSVWRDVSHRQNRTEQFDPHRIKNLFLLIQESREICQTERWLTCSINQIMKTVITIIC